MIKSVEKGRDHLHFTGKYRGAAHSICNSKFNMSSEIPVMFYSVWNFDYHFNTKELANKFEGEFECLWGKYKKAQNLFCYDKKWSDKSR